MRTHTFHLALVICVLLLPSFGWAQVDPSSPVLEEITDEWGTQNQYGSGIGLDLRVNPDLLNGGLLGEGSFDNEMGSTPFQVMGFVATEGMSEGEYGVNLRLYGSDGKPFAWLVLLNYPDNPDILWGRVKFDNGSERDEEFHRK